MQRHLAINKHGDYQVEILFYNLKKLIIHLIHQPLLLQSFISSHVLDPQNTINNVISLQNFEKMCIRYYMPSDECIKFTFPSKLQSVTRSEGVNNLLTYVHLQESTRVMFIGADILSRPPSSQPWSLLLASFTDVAEYDSKLYLSIGECDGLFLLFCYGYHRYLTTMFAVFQQNSRFYFALGVNFT